jgi:3-methyladenine DNA glycosylase AlkC
MAQALKLLYSRDYVAAMADATAVLSPAFDADSFQREVLAPPWNGLELKQRIRRIATTFANRLPGPYREQLRVIRALAPRFDGFRGIVFPDFVEIAGLDDFAASVPALAELTRHSSSEFAVRPFIVRYGSKMLDVMRTWSTDENEHVRRLASEGCRPRLPWGIALVELKRDPAPILPILAALRADPSDYVRRSVANNLNDIVKDHPDLVLDLAARWLGESTSTDKLVKHACRTLLKRGDQRALALFGEQDTGAVRVKRLVLGASTVKIGGVLAFSFVVSSEVAARARIEYSIDFLTKTGARSKKVFKVADKSLEAGQRLRIERRHRFTDFTTRKHHPGPHRLIILVNGVARARRGFVVAKKGR